MVADKQLGNEIMYDLKKFEEAEMKAKEHAQMYVGFVDILALVAVILSVLLIISWTLRWLSQGKIVKNGVKS